MLRRTRVLPSYSDKEVDVMRILNREETCTVAGAAGQCTEETSGNQYGSIDESEMHGDLVSAVYEDLVAAASHIIERVAESL